MIEEFLVEGRGGHRTRLDRGEQEGWGLRLPAALAENPAFGAWSGVRSVTVRVEKDRIVVRPAALPEDRVVARGVEAETGTTKEVGRLRWFDELKGYGFIELPSGEDRFFHRSGISCDPDELEPNLPLAFETQPGERGPVAVEVEPLKLPRYAGPSA